MALAHRGGAGLASNSGRENTVHAFTEAVKLGYRYLETDIHASADGVAVAFHDVSLDRVTGSKGLLSDLPLAALRDQRVGGCEPIPTLDELFETFPQIRFNIDLKADRAVRPLAEAIRRHGAEDRVCVGSFSSGRIRHFRQLMGPRVPTSVGPYGVAWYAYALALRRLRATEGVALQIPRRAWGDRLRLLKPSLLAAAHAAGRVVHVWTVDSADEMNWLIDVGVDGIVTDRPDVLKNVLVARDLWDGDR